MKGKPKVQPILHSRQTSDGRYYVKIRITQNRVSKFISLGIKIRKNEWNNNSNRVRSNCKDYVQYNQIIENELSKINTRNVPQSSLDTTQLLYTPIFNILNHRYELEKQNPDHYSIRKKLNTSIKHLVESGFSGTPLIDFTPEVVIRFDNYLRNRNGLQTSSIFSYHRIIRSTINRFCKINKIPGSIWDDPYSHDIIEKDRNTTPKFSLTGMEIHTMDEYLSFNPKKDTREFQSVCMFLFSYYSLGMRFGDVFKIRWDNFKDGVLKMKSEKTSTSLVPMKINDKQTNLIKYFTPLSDFYVHGEITSERIDEIRRWFPDVDKLIQKETEYRNIRLEKLKNVNMSSYSLLKMSIELEITEKKQDEVSLKLQGIIKDRDQLLKSFILKCCDILKTPIFPFNSGSLPDKLKVTRKKESSNTLVNKELRKVCKKLKIRVVTFHHSRHSFSHNSRISGKFDLLMISKCLGHRSLDVTLKYLNSFESTEIDESNQRFIEEDMNRYYNDTLTIIT